MLVWLRQRCMMAYEIARLSMESRRLKKEIEQETGEPIKLSLEEQATLARAAEGIDRRTLDQIAAFGADEILRNNRPNRDV